MLLHESDNLVNPVVVPEEEEAEVEVEEVEVEQPVHHALAVPTLKLTTKDSSPIPTQMTPTSRMKTEKLTCWIISDWRTKWLL